jgi:hypothetical protein
MKTDNEQIQVQTPRCLHCGLYGEVTVSRAGWERYLKQGVLIQLAFPELPVSIREQLITGTHPQCWNEMFSDSEY